MGLFSQFPVWLTVTCLHCQVLDVLLLFGVTQSLGCEYSYVPE